MLCFVADCNHQSYRERCNFFRFPSHQLKAWEKLCRRKDRRPTIADRICSCHFKNGDKTNGPTIFPWSKGMHFDFQDPNIISRAIRKSNILSSETPVENMEENVAACAIKETIENDHLYSMSYNSLVEKLSELNIELHETKLKIMNLETAKNPFTIDQIIDNEPKMLMYTSLRAEMFLIISDTLERFPLTYVDGWTPCSISRKDQLLMTLMKLKLNTPLLDLAERFCTSKATVHNIFITHIYALHEVFFQAMIENHIPSLLKCKSSMPASFGDFNCCRLVIDATEVTQDVPGQNMNVQSNTYSSYKNRHTVKAVTGVAPNGAVVYVSQLYPGSTSDVSIVEHSKMLSQLSPGDMVLADKGFTIHPLLPPGIHLNIPPFLKNKGQYTPAEVQICRKIARSRIHVERVNERIKNFDILSHIPQQFRYISTKIFQVCSMLVNFQDPMIAEISDNHFPDS